MEDDSVVIRFVMDDDDFQHLTVTSCHPGNLWHDQFGRFEHHTESIATPPRKEWKFAYWLEEGYLTLMFATRYLGHIGQDFDVFYDTNYPTEAGGYCIFTDYQTEFWRQSELRDPRRKDDD